MAALVNSEMCSRVPVIVILGATGSGKSKLGIEIARRFGGEILSADSMQAYKGLDIITNKVTAEEQAQAPHHLLDMVTPPRPFSVVEFRDAAVPLVDKLLKQKKLPVVVGGTNYYIESLLWRVLVTEAPDKPRDGASASAAGVGLKTSRSPPAREATDPAPARAAASAPAPDDDEDDDDDGEPLLKRACLEPQLEALPSPELHRRLQDVDPDMARRLHPNNRRRIIRSLQVFSQMGRRHSEILREQRSAEGGGALGGPLRYPHAAIFWLQCDQATLDARLDARVEDMLQRGLVAELLDFHKRYNAERLALNKEADYTKGIFQSIGFKEFHEYLVLEEAERDTARGRAMFQAAVAALKMVTRRYARKQVRWVVNRFLRQPKRQVPPVYAFDTSDTCKWDDVVYKPAEHVVNCLLEGKTPDIKPCPLEEPLTNEMTSFHCEVCDRIFIGNIQWEAHITSKKHKKVLNQKAKENKIEEGNTSLKDDKLKEEDQKEGKVNISNVESDQKQSKPVSPDGKVVLKPASEEKTT